jgi:xanthine dehydrogenase accessory factor
MQQPSHWDLAARAVSQDQPTVLIAIVGHHGSVPGKTGAMMVVTPENVAGTVGGGLVEHRLINLARSGPQNQILPFAHDGEASDSICSGQQTIAVVPLTPSHLAQLEILSEMEAEGTPGMLTLGPKGPSVDRGSIGPTLLTEEEENWHFTMPIGPLDTLTIIGGGHVGLALSRVMSALPFRIVVLDDREDLATLSQNTWAHEIRRIRWSEVAAAVPQGNRSWVVIMTRGHAHDTRVLTKLLPLDLRYLGMMGSAAKVRQVFASMEREGVSPQDIKGVHAPIGIAVNSHTPEEIAISIAAEIIQVKNQPH